MNDGNRKYVLAERSEEMEYYKDNAVKLLLGNSLELIKEIADESIDTIITDPPYFLSNGGVTCKSGEMVSVDKGDWDKENILSMDEFYYQFLSESRRVLKKDGTIWVFGTMHNIFSLGYIMQNLEYKILNKVTWQKTNPPPNLGCRMFTHSTENIIWAKKSKKSKHIFNYKLMKSMNNDKQMKDVWTSSTIKKREKKHGKHPTQKPLEIINRIILSSTNEGDIILDPFIGSGTTAVAGAMLKRKVIGIDLSKDFLDIAKLRLNSMEND